MIARDSPRHPALRAGSASLLAPAARVRPGRPRARQGRHRVDADLHGAGHPDDHPGPRAVLRRHGPLEERAVAADAGVHDLLHGRAALGHLRLQPRVHRGQRLHRRLRPALPAGHDHRLAGGHLQQGRVHPGVRVLRLPAHLRRHHAGADRRRLRRAHQVRRGAAVHGALVHLRLPADRAHGVVLGRPGRLHRRRRPALPPRRPRASCSRRARSTSPAARWCTSTPASPAWSAR